MKIQNELINRTPDYPSVGILKTIMIGGSITAVIALSGCDKKTKEGENSSDTKPKNGLIKKSDTDKNPKLKDKTHVKKGENTNNNNNNNNNNNTNKVIKMGGNIASPHPPKIKKENSDTNLKDSDKDGIPDIKDRCPNQRGQNNKDGCPPRKMGVRPPLKPSVKVSLPGGRRVIRPMVSKPPKTK
jgi:hypothetical protein